MLCHRCEHRVKNLETKGKWQPRLECGTTGMAVHTCYMFKPVEPLTLTKFDKSDIRSEFGPPIISARVKKAEKQIKMKADIKIDGDNFVYYWKPEEE